MATTLKGNGMTIPSWDFRDNVMITNNFIRLTQDTQGQKGSIWSKVVCKGYVTILRIDFKSQKRDHLVIFYKWIVIVVLPNVLNLYSLKIQFFI